MFGSWKSMAVLSGMLVLGIAGIQGTGNAETLVDCNFQVTAAGNGMQAMLNPTTPYLTLQTGQVFDLYKSGNSISSVDSNGVRWDRSLGENNAVFPVRNVNTGTVYMAVQQDTCWVDSQ
jgi:hypothetical protein